MDNQHNSHHTRRHSNRSSTNLHHLSLAPLTTRLPLDLSDADDIIPSLPPPPHTTSYLQGKSAPATPRLLSRSPARSSPSKHASSRSRSDDRRASAPGGLLAKKSKSAVHLPATPGAQNGHHRRSATGSRKFAKQGGALTPGGGARDRDARRDSDWLLRVGALVSTDTRETKGQSWLTTRESSTSLVALHAAEADLAEAAWERDRAVSRAASRAASRASSRRGSIVALEEGLLSSPVASRLGSRSHSRVKLSQTPGERRAAGDYFHGVHHRSVEVEEYMREGPDFINIDERLEGVVYEEDGEVEAVEEDHQVRMLVRREKAASAGGVSSWFGGVLGWPLFSVQESDEDWSEDEEGEDTPDGDEEEDGDGSRPRQERRRSSARFLEGDEAAKESSAQVPPPHAEQGGWQDAAWLLSVATKVIL